MPAREVQCACCFRRRASVVRSLPGVRRRVSDGRRAGTPPRAPGRRWGCSGSEEDLPRAGARWSPVAVQDQREAGFGQYVLDVGRIARGHAVFEGEQRVAEPGVPARGHVLEFGHGAAAEQADLRTKIAAQQRVVAEGVGTPSIRLIRKFRCSSRSITAWASAHPVSSSARAAENVSGTDVLTRNCRISSLCPARTCSIR